MRKAAAYENGPVEQRGESWWGKRGNGWSNILNMQGRRTSAHKGAALRQDGKQFMLEGSRKYII